ncbi:MAG TPA: hypothetical protein VGN17_11145 [Bryobacteraceae bacterium]|jgi:hypothetical protein
MKALAMFGLAVSMAGAQCYAAQLSGKLMDADCYNQKEVASREAGHKTYHSMTKTCAATATTTQFAMRVERSPYFEYEGDTIKLDAEGNSLAAKALEDGTLQPDRDGDVHVRARGEMTVDEVLRTRSLNGSVSAK